MRIAILSRRSSLYSTRRLIEAARALGHEVTVADPLRCYAVVDPKQPRLMCGNLDLSTHDVVIPRIGSSITEYGLAVVRQFEALGVPVVNGSLAIAQARDKLRSLQVIAEHGMAIPKTVMARDPALITEYLKLVGGPPVILKLLRGTQGTGVILAETEESLRSILDTLWGLDQNVLIQQFVREARGRDLRIFVVGDKVVSAMRRFAKGDEFRANIHRGGDGKPALPTPRARRMALEATAALGLKVAGVDLLESARGPLLLEVNASPGFEGLERASGDRVAEAILDYATSLAMGLRAVG